MFDKELGEIPEGALVNGKVYISDPRPGLDKGNLAIELLRLEKLVEDVSELIRKALKNLNETNVGEISIDETIQFTNKARIELEVLGFNFDNVGKLGLDIKTLELIRDTFIRTIGLFESNFKTNLN